MTSETAQLLVVAGLGYSTPNGRPLIQNLSFSIDRREVAMITGPNGVGKSTLLDVLRGSVQPDSGSFDMFASQYSFLPQLQNRKFHLPLKLHDVVRLGAKSVHQILEPSLLTESERSLAWNTASGGERQKALISRILAEKHELIILDEPTNHLDRHARSHLFPTLITFARKHGVGILVVCHDQALAEVDEKTAGSVKRINLAEFVAP